MSQSRKKKGNKYQELDNYEEVESAENPKAVDSEKPGEIRSADHIPKSQGASTSAGMTEHEVRDHSKHSHSSERKKEKAKELHQQSMSSFSPRSFKRTMLMFSGLNSACSEKDKVIALENCIKDLLQVLQSPLNLLMQTSYERSLITILSGDSRPVYTESVLKGLKKIFEILKDRNPNERTITHQELVEIILAILDPVDHKNIVDMLTDAGEKEGDGDGIAALRESYHEFSLKKLMQMSFVEKRKLKKKLPELTVETNSIKKPAQTTNKSANEPEQESEIEEGYCEIFQRNFTLIICSLLITALICVILLI